MPHFHREIRVHIPEQTRNPAVLRLHGLWSELQAQAGDERLPPAAALSPEALREFAADLVLVEPLPEGDYLYRYYGPGIAGIAGIDMTGRRNSEFGTDRGRFLKDTYDEVRRTRQPLYTIHRGEHAHGVLTWERLILPSSTDAGDTLLTVYIHPLEHKLELFESILETSGEGILFCEAISEAGTAVEDFRCVTVNRAAARMLDREPDDLLDRRLREVFPPGLREPLFAQFAQALDDGQNRRQLHEIGTGPSARSLSITASAAGDGVTAILSDVTELAQTRQALQRSEERFRDFAESASDWLWEMDAELRFSFISPSIERHTGRPASWYIGKSRWDLAAEGNGSAGWQAHREVLRLRQGFRDFQYLTRHEDGSAQWLSASGWPIFAQDGRFLGYRGIAADVTARKRDEQEIERQRSELQQLNEQKDRLLTIIGHDLKSPFLVILGCAEMLADPQRRLDEGRVHDYARMIHEAGSQAHAILDDLLEWASVVTGRIGYQPEVMDLHAQLASTVLAMASAAEAKGIRLTTRCEPGLRAHADPRMIRTVLRNLVSNAVKFTEKDGEIVVRCSPRGERIEISVSDTGVGMTAAQLGRLFALEYTRSTEGTRGEQGTGLGLHLCREMVLRHGTDLTAESDPGKGATFRFTLAAARPA